MEKELGATWASLDELLRQSDFVIVCCPLNDSTKGLFNAERFAAFKKGAVFINTSRYWPIDHHTATS